jgi:hypothetical protein
MDLRKLKTLIDLVAESGVSELEISEGEERVRIVNHRTPATFRRMHILQHLIKLFNNSFYQPKRHRKLKFKHRVLPKSLLVT